MPIFVESLAEVFGKYRREIFFFVVGALAASLITFYVSKDAPLKQILRDYGDVIGGIITAVGIVVAFVAHRESIDAPRREQAHRLAMFLHSQCIDLASLVYDELGLLYGNGISEDSDCGGVDPWTLERLRVMSGVTQDFPSLSVLSADFMQLERKVAANAATLLARIGLFRTYARAWKVDDQNISKKKAELLAGVACGLAIAARQTMKAVEDVYPKDHYFISIGFKQSFQRYVNYRRMDIRRRYAGSTTET